MLCGVARGPDGGSCDHDNDQLILQNFSNFLNDKATISSPQKKGLCRLQLVNEITICCLLVSDV